MPRYRIDGYAKFTAKYGEKRRYAFMELIEVDEEQVDDETLFKLTIEQHTKKYNKKDKIKDWKVIPQISLKWKDTNFSP